MPNYCLQTGYASEPLVTKQSGSRLRRTKKIGTLCKELASEPAKYPRVVLNRHGG